jgi:hypothetical protein
MLLKIKATSHTSIPDHGPQLQTMSYTLVAQPGFFPLDRFYKTL